MNISNMESMIASLEYMIPNEKAFRFETTSPVFAEDTPKNNEKYLSIMKQVENGELTWIQAKGEFLDFIP
jgi:hypothetical protein